MSESIPKFYFTRAWFTLRNQVIKRDGGRCLYCGDVALTADHVIPLHYWDKGNHQDNLVACCWTCNKLAGKLVFHGIDQKRAFLRDQRGMLGRPLKDDEFPMKPYEIKRDLPGMISECNALQWGVRGLR